MKSLTIGTKFRASFFAQFGLTLVLGMSSLLALRAMNQSFDAAVHKTAQKLRLVESIDVIKSDEDIALRGVALATFLRNRDGANGERRQFEAQAAKMKATLEELTPLATLPEAKRLVSQLQADFDKWLTVFPEFARLCDSGNPTKATQYGFANFPPLLGDFADTTAKLITLYQDALASDSAAAADQYARNLWIAAAMIGLTFLLGGFIFRQTGQVSTQLRSVVGELSSGSDQVAAAAGQIASSSQSLSQGASEQASSVEEISASMEEMTAMSRTSGANSSEAMSMMVATAAQVERSNAALQEMVSSMSSIKSSSERVAKINKTIDEIAFQTNILALNAAVEAARAGEAGQGFAVVADEVRNLAQRAAAAAKDTAALIEESIANSNQGSQKLELVSAAIRGITEGAQKVQQLVAELNEAGKQQVQGIQQVSTAIQQVSTVTQTNAASAEESAGAAQELNAQSMTVRELVNHLRRMVDGGEGGDTGRVQTVRSIDGGRPHSRTVVAPVSPKAGAHPEDSFPMETEESGSFRSF